MADIKVGGSNGSDGLNYIGNIGEVWIDKNNNLRRSDGHTPGGIIISGGAGFDGQYSSLTGKPTIPTDVSNLTDTTNLLSDTFSGSYNDLTNKPALFDGDYTNLTNKPALFDGDYTNLTNKPALFDGAFSSLSGTPSLFSGSYNDLTNKPTLFDGQFSSLTGTPTTLAGYGITDGGSSYSDSDVETYLSGGWDFHLLPDTNATYDIGSAEYKVRHLFLSDNSLYIGDNTLRTSGNNLLFDGEDVQDYNNLKNKPDLSAITTATAAIAEETNRAIAAEQANATAIANIEPTPTIASSGTFAGSGTYTTVDTYTKSASNRVVYYRIWATGSDTVTTPDFADLTNNYINFHEIKVIQKDDSIWVLPEPNGFSGSGVGFVGYRVIQQNSNTEVALQIESNLEYTSYKIIKGFGASEFDGDYNNLTNKPDLSAIATNTAAIASLQKNPLMVQLYEYNTPFPQVNSGRDDLTGKLDISDHPISTDQIKYGNASKYMFGSSTSGMWEEIDPYINIPGHPYSNSDAATTAYGMDTFTQEFWAYFEPPSQNYLQQILSCNANAVNQTSNGLYDVRRSNDRHRWGIYYDPSLGGGRVYYHIDDDNNNNSFQDDEYTDSITLNDAWNHYAYVRNQDEVKLFINGTTLATIDISSLPGAETDKWRWRPYDILNFTGLSGGGKTYISQFRLTLQALYSSNFTPGDLSA